MTGSAIARPGLCGLQLLFTVVLGSCSDLGGVFMAMSTITVRPPSIKMRRSLSLRKYKQSPVFALSPADTGCGYNGLVSTAPICPQYRGRNSDRITEQTSNGSRTSITAKPAARALALPTPESRRHSRRSRLTDALP